MRVIRLYRSLIALLLVFGGLSGAAATAPGATKSAAGSVAGEGASNGHRTTEHLYRIVGKVRLLFFWMTADDVGGARISWHTGERAQVLSLLIGSDPERAPRGVNEWGYIREAVVNDSTNIFGMRTLTDGDSPADADARRTVPGGLAEFGVLCSTILPFEANSRTTTVHVSRDATYRAAGRVLDVVEREAHWNRHQMARPQAVAPGFLTAVDLMMRSSAASARETGGAPNCPRLAYVYKDAVYDLIPRHLERIAELRTRAGIYRNLLRGEMSIRNRQTGSTTSFSITYGTDGLLAGVPIAARYQPNWWFKVELELDDRVDVPADPSRNVSLQQRITKLCDAAHRR
jgi:hypothetical protein